MFKKPFKLSGNTKLKKALYKRFLQSVHTSLPQVASLSEEQLNPVLPTKLTHFEINRIKGSRLVFYTNGGVPVYIDADGKGDILPTVFSCWRVPEQILTFTVNAGAIQPVLNGAEFMAPGLLHPLEELPEFQANQAVALALPNSKVFAVGITLTSSEHLRNAGALRGKLVHVEHLIGDHLFLHGWTTSSSPYCNLPEDIEEFFTKALPLPARCKVVPIEETEGAEEETAGETPEGEESAPAETKPAEKEEEPSEEDVQTPTEVVAPRMTMDEVLKMTFLQTLKVAITKEDLPIIGTVFYSQFMQNNCPRGKKLDMKQTSYKKLNKFLTVMSKEGLITIKTLPKSEIQIVTVNKEHPKLVEYEAYKPEKAPKTDVKDTQPSAKECGDSRSLGKIGEFKITTLYRPTVDQFPVFAAAFEDVKKDSVFTRPQVTEALRSYTTSKELAVPDDANSVRLDAVLARVFKKQKAENDLVSKADLSKKFLGALQLHHEVLRDGVPILLKGELTPIQSREERRGGHKSVTRVKGLEMFGVSPANVAKELRKQFAASCSVSEIPGGKNSHLGTPVQEVVIQGKMNGAVVDYLTNSYKIPQKYIETFSK